MNKQSSGSDNSQRHDPLAPARTLSTDALARRRLLLKGATGGATAAAALTPVGALATGSSTVLYCIGTNGKKYLATVSGVASAAHSFGPNVVQIPACGKHVTYWKNNQSSWPSSISPKDCRTGSRVDDLLPGCNSKFTVKDWSRDQTKTIWALTNCPTDVESIFIAAYLNGATRHDAAWPTASKAFPYSSAQVKEFWDKGGAPRSNAAALFALIMTESA